MMCAIIPIENTKIAVKIINNETKSISKLVKMIEITNADKPSSIISTKNGKKILKGLKNAETESIKPNVRIESLMILTLVTPFLPKYWIGS